jgi:hypothetical protein
MVLLFLPLLVPVMGLIALARTGNYFGYSKSSITLCCSTFGFCGGRWGQSSSATGPAEQGRACTTVSSQALTPAHAAPGIAPLVFTEEGFD